MTNYRDTLRLPGVPATSTEAADRLDSLVDHLKTLRVTEKAAGRPVDRLDADCAAVEDLWFNWEATPYGAGSDAEDEGDPVPKTDPLTRLHVAEQYGLMDKDLAKRLQLAFSEEATRIIGEPLHPHQVARFYTLLNRFNTFKLA